MQHLTLIMAIAIAGAAAGCSRTAVGSSLLASGAVGGYCGIDVAGGSKVSGGPTVEPHPQAGVPLVLSGALASGIGLSLIAMGDVRHKLPPPTRARVNEEPPLPVVYPKVSPDPWSSDRAVNAPPLTYAAKPFTTEVHR